MANSGLEKLEIQSKFPDLDSNSNTNRNGGGDAQLVEAAVFSSLVYVLGRHMDGVKCFTTSGQQRQGSPKNSSPLDRSLAGVFAPSSSPRILCARRLRSTAAVDKTQSNWQAMAARCQWLGITRWMDATPPNAIRRTPDPGDRREPDPGLRRLRRRRLEWLAVVRPAGRISTPSTRAASTVSSTC